MLLLAFTALGNVFFLTLSPVYEFQKYFSYLPQTLSTWKIHHASFLLSHNLVNMKTALFSGRSAGFFQPVAAFPAFHSGYAFLLFLAFKDRRPPARRALRLGEYLRYVLFVFWFVIVSGGIVLGYHGFLDTGVATIAATVFFPKPKNYENPA